jgi:CubicO group peptidase (beta-lactamase class C family)
MYKTARMFCAPIGRLFWAIPITLCLSMQLIAPAFAQAIRRDLLQTEVASDPRPMALFVTGQGVASAYAVSTAGKSGKAGNKPLGPDTPVRVASNTKTFVAATVLRLWEQGRIDLDAAIGPLLTPRLDALMRSGGLLRSELR